MTRAILITAAAIGLLWGFLAAYADIHSLAHAGEWDLEDDRGPQ